MSAIELQVAAINSDVLFQPLGETPLRGKTDFMAAADGGALRMAKDFPKGIPPMHLAVDLERATATITDPLADEAGKPDAWGSERELLGRRGMKPHARQELANLDIVEWSYWLTRNVEAGLLKIVEGKLPKNPKRPDSLTKRERQAETEDEMKSLRQRVADQDARIDRLVDALEKLAGAKAG